MAPAHPARPSHTPPPPPRAHVRLPGRLSAPQQVAPEQLVAGRQPQPSPGRRHGALGVPGVAPQRGQPVRGVRNPGPDLVLQPLGGQPGIARRVAAVQERPADLLERPGQVARLGRTPGRRQRGMPGERLEHLPVHPDTGAEPEPPGWVRGQVRPSDAVGAEPRRGLAQGRVTLGGADPTRPDRGGERAPRHAAGVGRQVHQHLGEQASLAGGHLGRARPRRPGRAGDPHRRGTARFQVLGGDRAGGQRGQQHALGPGPPHRTGRRPRRAAGPAPAGPAHRNRARRRAAGPPG